MLRVVVKCDLLRLVPGEMGRCGGLGSEVCLGALLRFEVLKGMKGCSVFLRMDD